MSPRRCLPRGAAAFAFALLALASAPQPAHAVRNLQVQRLPEVATFTDPVEVVVTGISTTPCGPSAVSLSLVQVGQGNNWFERPLQLRLDEPCRHVGPLVEEAFERRVNVGFLVPGRYELALQHPEGTMQRELWVYEQGSVGLVLPELSTTAAPGVLRLRGYGSCEGADAAVNGNVIDVIYTTDCWILAPPPHAFTLEVPLPALPARTYDVRVLDSTYSPSGIPGLVRGTLRVWDAERCVPSATELCLRDGRFRVTATWRDFAQSTGVAHPLPLAGDDGTGLLWFFAADNAELTVKVLDGCGYNDRWWAFVSSGSTVAYEVKVTDTATGISRSYLNGLGEVPELIADTDAFDCP